MKKKLALGKGMASLIGPKPFVDTQDNDIDISNQVQAPVAYPEELSRRVLELSLDEIVVNPEQPRKHFDEVLLNELSQSIRENGVIQPILVRALAKGYEIIAGERRVRAAKLAGLEKVPAIINDKNEQDQLVISIIENVQRAELNCVEEALAYKQLVDEYNLTQEEVAKKVGKERSSIANLLRVLQLPEEVQELLIKGELNLGHAKVLATKKLSKDALILLAQKAASKKLSVRELEKELKSLSPAVEADSDKPKSGPSWDQLRNELEETTGFHISIATKNNGTGVIGIKFHSVDEFNKIYDYFLNNN